MAKPKRKTAKRGAKKASKKTTKRGAKRAPKKTARGGRQTSVAERPEPAANESTVGLKEQLDDARDHWRRYKEAGRKKATIIRGYNERIKAHVDAVSMILSYDEDEETEAVDPKKRDRLEKACEIDPKWYRSKAHAFDQASRLWREIDHLKGRKASEVEAINAKIRAEEAHVDAALESTQIALVDKDGRPVAPQSDDHELLGKTVAARLGERMVHGELVAVKDGVATVFLSEPIEVDDCDTLDRIHPAEEDLVEVVDGFAIGDYVEDIKGWHGEVVEHTEFQGQPAAVVRPPIGSDSVRIKQAIKLRPSEIGSLEE